MRFLREQAIWAALVFAIISTASATRAATTIAAPGVACDQIAAPAPPPEDTANPLAARLGGSVDQFDHRYGVPTVSTFGRDYEVHGFGGISVDEYDGYIETIRVYPPRPAGQDWDIGTPNDDNWAPATACDLARQFLPVDAVLRPSISDMSVIGNYPCSSDALAANVPDSVYAYVANDYAVGDCSAVLQFDNDGKGVSLITIQLKIERPL